MSPDYDYYFYDDYLDTRTRTGDVTLGGSTRYEAKPPTKNSFNDIDSILSYDDSETYPSNPFDSFPFRIDGSSLRDSVASRPPKEAPTLNTIRRPSPRQGTKNKDRPPRRKVSLGFPAFKFPKLPSLKVGDPIVNATAFTNISRLSSSVKNSVQPPTVDNKKDEIYTKIKKQSPILIRHSLSSPDFRYNFANKNKLFTKKLNGTKLPVDHGQNNINPTENPVNAQQQTTKTDLLGPFKTQGSLGFPFMHAEQDEHRKKLIYHSPPRKSTSPPMTTERNKTKKPLFEVKENPTQKPIVIARPYDHITANENRKNHQDEKMYSERSQTIHHNEPNRVPNYGTKENNEIKYRANKKHGHLTLDPDTGLPYATNNGFDPSTVVFEDDFRPIGVGGSEINSPLTFKVSSSVHHVGFLPQKPHHQTSTNVQSFSGHIDSNSGKSTLIQSVEPSASTPKDNLSQIQVQHQQPQNYQYKPHVHLPYQTYQNEAASYSNTNKNFEVIERSHVYRPPLPAFKLRPPPPPPGSPYKRYARKMSGFEDNNRDTVPEFHSRTGASSTRATQDSAGILSEALTSLPFFLQAPYPRSEPQIPASVKVFDHSRREGAADVHNHRRNLNAESFEKANHPVTFESNSKIMRRLLPLIEIKNKNATLTKGSPAPTERPPKAEKPRFKYDFSKTQEQLVKLVTKSTHLTILKDIWDNLTDEKTHGSY